MVTDLRTKKCIACSGTEAPLIKEAVEEYLVSVTGWELTKEKTTIQKDFSFADFATALFFVNAVGVVAEEEGHHPDIFLHDYKQVKITLSTHEIGGLSENDFIVAAKIDVII